jgi:hypothetical protein
MAFGIDFPAFGASNPLLGGTLPYTAIDTYNAALENNGASQLLGSLYFQPLTPTGQASNGGGSNQILKYVRYNPTTSVAIQAGPALVYWKDETFTTVTPTLSEALGASQNSVAGWLLYNTTTLSTATAAQINGNFAWILVGGFNPGAVAPASTAIGDVVIGATGSFTGARVAAGTAPGYRIAGYALTAVASGLADFNVPFLN